MSASALNIAAEVVAIEQAGVQALHDALTAPESPLAASFDAAIELLRGIPGRTVVTGMGKSGHIGRKIAATFASTGQAAMFVHPAEASHGDLGMIGEGDAVIALSNSGETPELSDIIAYCGRFSIPLIAVTSGANSALARAANILLLLPRAAEACTETRAPTTSTTLSLVLGDALAVALLRGRGFTRDHFGVFHPGGKLGASLKKVRALMHEGRELPLVAEGAAMSTAIEVLNRCGFGCVGVTDAAGRLIGIVTDGDIRRHLHADVLRDTVERVMTRGPKVVTPDTLAAEALGQLSRTRITALFVVDADGKPVGILHVHDMLVTGVV